MRTVAITMVAKYVGHVGFLAAVVIMGFGCAGEIGPQTPGTSVQSSTPDDPDGGTNPSDPPAPQPPAPQPPAPNPPPPSSECAAQNVQEVIAFANQARAAAGLSAVQCDDALTKASRLHAEDMCARNYFDHNAKAPAPNGVTPAERATKAGFTHFTSAENIAAGQNSPQDAHTTWMNSPGHKANILGADAKYMGVGYKPCTGADYSPYWVQMFGY